MYLKSIKAQGFKSFADKIDLEINPGITGIVGPNGSGKSNIVDAVRWVLGEQSAKSLRSSTMSDVIFNGSNSRDPQKRAYVALAFDNSDHYLNSEFLEVEVKRVVYKTGENEYFLNGTRVRLKDITDLFIESGVGTSDFNIISQGNVTDIINSKSSERREIFEATARVLKYKNRKEESLKKLAKTEENLLRVDLIIKELEETVKPLKTQSEKAQKYVDIKNELETLDIALMCEDITSVNTEYQVLQKEIAILKTDLTNFANSKIDANLEQKKLAKLKIDDEINSLHDALLEITKKLSNLHNEKKLILERQKYHVDEANINENLLKIKEDNLNNTQKLEILASEEKSLNTEYHQTKMQEENISNDLLKLKIKRTNLETSIREKNQNILINQNKINILENNLANDLASPLPVKSVLNNPRLKGIHNPITKIIQTKDAYLEALDVALGAAKNYLVTDDEKAAMAAIEYLKSQKLGRATFYPLNIIKERSLSSDIKQKIQNEPGYIDVFSNLVTYDKIYEAIVGNCLGNIVVVENSEALRKIAKLCDYKVKIVSLEGEISNVGGSLTGGRTKNNNSFLYDKKQLSELQENLKEDNLLLASFNENLTNLNKEILNLENEDNELKQNLILFKSNIEQKSAERKIIEDQIAANENELKDIESLKTNTLEDKILVLLEEINIVEKDQKIKEKDFQKLSTQKSNLTEEINVLEKEVKENNALYNTKQSEINNKEIALGKLEVKLDNLLVSLNEEYNLTYEAANDKYVLEIDQDLARSKVLNLKKELSKLGNVNIGAIAEYERLNKRYEFLTNQKEDLTKASLELKDIIAKMDEIMIAKFTTTFDEIKKEFARIFKLMFKGGRGELKLTNPDDLLNTGIDIIAIPPGKKIASPLSLSGGEKALTAICLLFAILEVRPSPFIILDEAEAALDEANIDMFGSYLNKEKAKSQFILITHKKRMMEYADALYGITMQESGVSKIVSTKLEN